MDKNYEQPVLEVADVCDEDVIITSVVNSDGTINPEPDDLFNF